MWFTDEQKLRALELNSWQLLRLLRAHIWDLCCGDFVCGINDGVDLVINGSFENDKEKFTHLFSRAIGAHNKWKVHQDSRLCDFQLSIISCSSLRNTRLLLYASCNTSASYFRFSNTDGVSVAIASYYDFLGNASEWLSHRATDVISLPFS